MVMAVSFSGKCSIAPKRMFIIGIRPRIDRKKKTRDPAENVFDFLIFDFLYKSTATVNYTGCTFSIYN